MVVDVGATSDLSGSDLSGAALRSRRRRVMESGQSMVEMALVLPIFLTFVFSIIEIGRAWYVKQSITVAAREGARVLILPVGGGLAFENEIQLQKAAVDTVNSYLADAGVAVGPRTKVDLLLVRPGEDLVYTANDYASAVVGYTEAKRGDRVGVRIEHDFDTVLPIILKMFDYGGSETGTKIRAASFMTHE